MPFCRTAQDEAVGLGDLVRELTFLNNFATNRERRCGNGTQLRRMPGRRESDDQSLYVLILLRFLRLTAFML